MPSGLSDAVFLMMEQASIDARKFGASVPARARTRRVCPCGRAQVQLMHCKDVPLRVLVVRCAGGSRRGGRRDARPLLDGGAAGF